MQTLGVQQGYKLCLSEHTIFLAAPFLVALVHGSGNHALRQSHLSPFAMLVGIFGEYMRQDTIAQGIISPVNPLRLNLASHRSTAKD